MNNTLNDDTSKSQTAVIKPLYEAPKLVTIDVGGQTGDSGNDSTHPDSNIDGSGAS